MLGVRSRRPPPFGGVHVNDDKDIQIHRPEEASRHNLWAESRLLLRDLIFALMLAALVVVFIVQPVKVEGTSMLPRLHDGERIFVNKLIYYDEYRWAPKVDRGDIVVFWYPEDPSKSYIKRVVGLPGDTVEVREGIVLINGSELDENYLDHRYNLSPKTQPPVYVKQNYYFVMGD
ncbi:MAG TPA: signal peptidase I, partial [Pyrinomonadaceae bacterium]|nr:signal peptidase I [Pyrinomonadaceae bacterium]